MPVFFQEEINNTTKLGIWQIEEPESFFREKVPLHREVTHPHKRLQHLAGRFLLQYLVPGFPGHLIRIADTKKPFLPDEAYHFSISHCGNFAAALVSSSHRVGVDVEAPSAKTQLLHQKFIGDKEMDIIHPKTIEEFTQIWSAKEAVFKWYGYGKVDFKEHIQLRLYHEQASFFDCYFSKNETSLQVFTRRFPGLCLSYVVTPPQRAL